MTTLTTTPGTGLWPALLIALFIGCVLIVPLGMAAEALVHGVRRFRRNRRQRSAERLVRLARRDEAWETLLAAHGAEMFATGYAAAVRDREWEAAEHEAEALELANSGASGNTAGTRLLSGLRVSRGIDG